MAYKYDVFISYRRTFPTFARWIPETFFVPFVDYLSQKLLRPAKVFWDENSIYDGDQWESRIYDALAHSTVLVPVIIPTYFVSTWCLREYAAFDRRQQELNLAPNGIIFPIYLQNGDYPSYATKNQGRKWHEYHHSYLNPKGDVYVEFHKELDIFTTNLGKALKNPPHWDPAWKDSKTWCDKPFQNLSQKTKTFLKKASAPSLSS